MTTAAEPIPVDEFTIHVEQLDDYEFKIRFDKPQFAEWQLDEPAPLGRDRAPNAARALAAAIGNCLSASLLFCARKAKVNLGPVRTEVRTQVARSDRGRLRIVKVEAHIDPAVAEAGRHRLLRCLDLFEDYCLVTQSVRQGIEVKVSVEGFPPKTEGAA